MLKELLEWERWGMWRPRLPEPSEQAAICSSQALTARKALGQETCGRSLVSGSFFFLDALPFRSLGRGLSWSSRRFCYRNASLMIPAKGKGTTHQLPMASHGLVTPDLILRPPQRVFHLFVTLLDPHAQPVETHDLLYARDSEFAVLRTLRPRGREVGNQVERGEIGQGRRISGRDHDPLRFLRAKGTDVEFQRLPVLHRAIMKGARDLDPTAWMFRIFPSSLLCCLLERADFRFGMIPGMGWLQR